ncbi:hypothetical protein Tco_0924561 [Tanacetum coccineum]|uniref:Gag-Pol polyprotein n=1 Tax=Tanacetum coccineum TaxID=301880 RepID=A0ABQ5D6Y5_9ASTR
MLSSNKTRQFAADPEMCMFALTVSIVEPKNIKEAIADSAWIKAMQDELHQFDRLNVWELVDKKFGKDGEGTDFEESFAHSARAKKFGFCCPRSTHSIFPSIRWTLILVFRLMVPEGRGLRCSAEGFIDPVHQKKFTF